MFIEICNFIEGMTSFSKGSTLQVGHRVQTAPEDCVLVSEIGGGLANFYLPDSVDLMIQIISRGKTYFTARDQAWEVFDAIHGTAGWNLPSAGSGDDYIALTIQAMATPQYLGVSENRLHEFSTNYIFRMKVGSCRES